MKKIIGIFGIYCALNSAMAASFVWPNYVDNTACLAASVGSYPECGSSIPQLPQWSEAGSTTSLSNVVANLGAYVNKKTDSNIELSYVKYKMVFWGQINNYSGGPNVDTTPLESSASGHPYRLVGLNGSSFDVFYSGCWAWPVASGNVIPPSCYKNNTISRKWIGSINYNDMLASSTGESPKIEHEFVAMEGKYPFRIDSLDITFARKLNASGGLNTMRLRSYAKTQEQAQVRTIRFPGFNLNYQIWAVKSDGSETGKSQNYVPMVATKVARLNDRTCELRTKSHIDFGKVTLTGSQTGKLAEEQATIGLVCNGIFDGQNPNGTGPVYNTGSYVSHTVTGVRLTTPDDKSVIGMDSLKKIGFTDQNGINAQNLYVEGSFVGDQECGVDPIAIGETTINNWNNFGDANSSITVDPYNTVHWRLCKKPGTVPRGNYTGTATLNIKYK